MGKALTNVLLLSLGLGALSLAKACSPRSDIDQGSETSEINKGNQRPISAEEQQKLDSLHQTIEELKGRLSEGSLSSAERERMSMELSRAEGEIKKTAAQIPSATPSPSPSPSASVAPRLFAFYYPGTNDCVQAWDPSRLEEGQTFRGVPCMAQNEAQRFAVEERAPGEMRLILRAANRCLSFDPNHVGTEGSAMSLRGCKPEKPAYEYWRKLQSAAGAFKLQNVQSGFCLKIGVDGAIFQGNCSNNYTDLMQRAL